MTAPLRVTTVIADTGEIKERTLDPAAEEAFFPTSLDMALALVPELSEAIDRAYVRGDGKLDIHIVSPE